MRNALPSEWNLTLLGYWQLRRRGEPVEVSARQQRVITVVALLGSRSRRFVANLLWPECSELQAAGSLRASVFRISHQLPLLMQSAGDPLTLDTHVAVDVHSVRQLIHEIVTIHDATGPTDPTDVLRSADLLPGWYEDWVIFEQERLQQQRLSALEALARHYLEAGDHDRSLDASSAAVAIEPLRESAQLLLVQGHLAAGNHASAAVVYQRLRASLHSEMGIAPSPRFAELLESAVPLAAGGGASAPELQLRPALARRILSMN